MRRCDCPTIWATYHLSVIYICRNNELLHSTFTRTLSKRLLKIRILYHYWIQATVVYRCSKVINSTSFHAFRLARILGDILSTSRVSVNSNILVVFLGDYKTRNNIKKLIYIYKYILTKWRKPFPKSIYLMFFYIWSFFKVY